MQQDEWLARIGALLADRSRSAMLMLLMDGRAYTATELARAANIAAPTASHHLEKFLDAGFLDVLQQGRHRYFRIADADVAAFIETALSMHAGLPVGKIKTTCPVNLRHARLCYEHLAGECGVTLLTSGLERGLFRSEGERIVVAAPGEPFLAEIGVDTSDLHGRFCLDWSERRFHLAGPLAAAITQRVLDERWFLRGKKRELLMTEKGRRGMAKWFK